MLFVPKIQATRERLDLSLFDKTKFESLWTECLINFSKNFQDKTLIIFKYNSNMSMQAKVLENLGLNKDKLRSIPSSITIMGVLTFW